MNDKNTEEKRQSGYDCVLIEPGGRPSKVQSKGYALDDFGQAHGTTLRWWHYSDYKRAYANSGFEFVEHVEDIDELQDWLAKTARKFVS